MSDLQLTSMHPCPSGPSIAYLRFYLREQLNWLFSFHRKDLEVYVATLSNAGVILVWIGVSSQEHPLISAMTLRNFSP